MDLYIDPALQAVIPPPTDQEHAQLEASLLAEPDERTDFSQPDMKLVDFGRGGRWAHDQRV
jgi:hypothetical protein